MFEQDSFCGTTFNDGKLEVVGIYGKGRTGLKIYACHCNVCAKDPELFGDAIFKIMKHNLVAGSLPCGCSSAPHWDANQYQIILTRKGADRYSVVVPKDATHRTKVQCTCLSDSCGLNWSATIAELVTHSRGCSKCANKVRGEAQYLPESEAIDRIQKVCSDNNWTFGGFANGWVGSTRTKLTLTCHCGYKWSPTFTNITHHKAGCPKCSGKLAVTEENAVSVIQNICSDKGWSFGGFESGWVGVQKSKLRLTCHCGCNWTPVYNNVVHSRRGCPSCARYGYDPSKPGTFYVYRWTHPKTNDQFLKYGITAKPKQRISQQRRNTEYIPTKLCSIKFKNGQDASDLETAVSMHKQMHDLPDGVSKDVFPDGYTETLSISEWPCISNIIQHTGRN